MIRSWYVSMLLFWGLAAQAQDLLVSDAWLREPPPGQRMAALYMHLHNPGTAPIKVTGVHVEGASGASFHTVIQRNGMSAMRSVRVLELAPGGDVVMAPGGYHVMVFGLTRTPQAGEQIRFCLGLRGGKEQCVKAQVRGLGDQADG